MMSVTAWGTLKVDQFFQDYNWMGLPPKVNTTETVLEREEKTSLFCLSVREFFGQNNWRGQPSTPSWESNPIRTVPTLLMPVGQFFQLPIWQGDTKVGVVSKSQSKSETIVSDSQKYKLSALSDLF